MIDYRALLKRYMAVIIEAEGSDYIESWTPSDMLSDEERRLLREIAAELRAEQ